MGRITGVVVTEGETVHDGDPLLSVDGQLRPAHVASAPFYRELRLGDSGEDVQELDRWLVSAGFSSSPTLADGRFSTATGRAVRAFERSVGATSADGVFRPADVVWLPDEFVVGLVPVFTGQELSGGEVLLESEVAVIDATIELVGDPTRRSVLDGREVTVVLPSGRSYDLGVEWQTTLDRVRWSREVESVGQRELEGLTVRLTSALRVATIPASALLTDASGTSCIFVLRDREALQPTRIDALNLVSPEVGILYLPFELAGLRVMTNPAHSVDLMSCR